MIAQPPLQILHLEDDPNDGFLVRTALETGGMPIALQLVADEAAYRAALEAGPPDLILSDYKLPGFDGLQALAIARERYPDVPFIFVSGTIGEELAIEVARNGANYYVLKSRLFRLPIAIQAALREGETLTARRRAERALVESEAVTMQLMDSAPEPILIQSEGLIVYANAALHRLLGATTQENLLGRPVIELVQPDDREPGATGLGRLMDLHQGLTQRHRHLQRLDGARVEVAINTVPTTCQGRGGVLVMIRNISEREQLEERTRQAQKMEAIGRLAGGIAHDFNNILTVINGYAELLLTARSESDPDRAPLEEIKSAGERAAALTRQLLAFSRRQVISPGTLDFNDSLRGMEGLLRRLIGEEIELSLAPAAAPVFALVDAAQMEQVILNLAVNARDAIKRGGRITLATGQARDLPRALQNEAARPADGWSLLTVTDTGAGMDSEVLRHLFEPFYTTKAQGEGTGLGLATVYAIVQGANGQIEVQSEVGRGTAVTVYLPAAQAAAPEPPAPAAALPAISGRRTRITILLAEDEGALRLLAEKVLSRAGYRVQAVADGAAALQFLQRSSKPVDLLLTDVVMPGMSGPELAGQARRLCPKLRVLYMSGYNDEQILQHGIQNNGVGFMQKPYTPKQLLAAIERLLSVNN